MFGSFGPWEIMLILVVLLLVFGAKRLPELGGSLGKGIREFKRSVRDIESELSRPTEEVSREIRAAARPAQVTQSEQAQPAELPGESK
jgi:sec-independent protein translocase protein TatA